MMIDLSKKDYKDLVKLVFLGEWVVNALKENTEDYQFTNIEQHIYSYFKEFNCEELIEYDEESETYLPTKKMEKEILPYLEDYLESLRGDFIGFN